MSLFDLGTSTRTFGFSSAMGLAREHVLSVLRHMTLTRALNLIKAEVSRLTGRCRLSSMPYFMKVETTAICNLDCRWCTGSRRDRGVGERSIGNMTPEQFRRILDQAGRHLFRINLYGFGEPLLFPETFEMIREASSRNIGVAVSSNMNLRSPTLAVDILNSGLELLILSCHGASQETVRRFMGEKADMDLALETVTGVLRERSRRGSRYPRVHWQYCVTGFNEHEMDRAREMAREIGVDALRFLRPGFPPEAGAEWYSTLFPRRSALTSDFKGRSCAWPWRGLYINWDGGLLPCCRSELFPENDFGNVMEESFESIWNGPRYRESRRLVASRGRSQPVFPTVCSSCPVLGFLPRRMTPPE